MWSLRYTYNFSDINAATSVEVTDHYTNQLHRLRVALNDTQFLAASSRPIAGEVADLIDLAVAVHTADRWSYRRKDLTRRIELILPVRHPHLFSNSQIIESLRDILYWYTGDDWVFEFRQRMTLPPISG